MECSNGGTETANANNRKLKQQPVMSPVPDLVTNVPTNAATPATIVPSTEITNSPKSETTSVHTNDAPVSSAVPVQPTPVAKPTPAVTGKTTAPTQSNPVPPRATSLPSAASEASVKNRNSREEKSRKKDDKSVDHVLRALNSLNTSEEKLAAMCKKYADIFDEHRKLQLLHKQTEKRCSVLQREKEQLQAEHSKAILTRSRLENLCRELQRQNKAIKDESLLKIREEEEKRKEVSAKFQTTMNEITTLMQQNNDKNMKLRDDNIDMTTKLKNICEQYELRQQQVERISKQMQLEQQLADTKLSKLKMEMAAEREILLREKQQLLMELQQYQQRCTEFQTTEVNLRNQISLYNDKYDEFQKALARSNDVFGGFKGEMEKMSKKICKLEKETSSWKQRWERSHNALLEMAADKQKSEQELAVVSRQLATLQNLCRTLQTERSTLLAKLKNFQGGAIESLEKTTVNQATMEKKCSKQCDQSQNHMDQGLNLNVNTDSVMDQYNKDILTSFEESPTATDTPSVGGTAAPAISADIVCSQSTVPVSTSTCLTTNSANIVDGETVVPMPTSLLPDVVGAGKVFSLDQKPDLNSDMCQRLENLTLGPSSPTIEEKSTIKQNCVDQQSNFELDSNLLVIQGNIGMPEHNIDTTLNHQSVIVENKTPQVVLNGDAHGDTPSPADMSPQQEQLLLSSPQSQSPKSPTAKGSPTKCADSGKKIKESTKKKKK